MEQSALEKLLGKAIGKAEKLLDQAESFEDVSNALNLLERILGMIMYLFQSEQKPEE